MLGLATGIAYATIPDGQQAYTPRRLKAIGTIRLINPSLSASNPQSHCTSLEIQFAFNAQGQPGASGPTATTATPAPRATLAPLEV